MTTRVLTGGVAAVGIGPQGPPGPAGPQGPSGDPFVFPNRVDCSVNRGRVAGVYSDAPVLHTQPGGNVAGGYNGGGVGSKSMLGFRTADSLALSAWSGLEYTYRDLAPATSVLQPFANMIVDINGNNTVYKVFVVDPLAVPPLNLATIVTNGDGSKTVTHTAGTHYLLVVNDLAGVVPFVSLGPSWLEHGYRRADILAVYPSARFKEAASGDGGLPAAQSTPALLLGVGDSGNNKIHAARLTSVRFNSLVV